ncbi:MAG: polysaccharide deacetylase family protein [Actinomycetota bacterium]|nr:polysaccharide deacetylase family protein [Actinomycetota bacterium]
MALAYHGVADVPLRRDPYRLFTPPAALARHIRLLRSWGYELVAFGELARRVGQGEASGAVALTFDDGFADNLHVLLPLLEREGAPATVFVISSGFGEPHPDVPTALRLTAPEVRTLARAGVEVGAHSHTHRDLSILSYHEVLEDARRSRQVLEELVDGPVEVMAYPYGRAGPETRRACGDAGYVAACRTTGQGSWSDPLDLPRQDMTNRCTSLGLRLKRDDRYEALVRTWPGRVARGVFRRAQLLVP